MAVLLSSRAARLAAHCLGTRSLECPFCPEQIKQAASVCRFFCAVKNYRAAELLAAGCRIILGRKKQGRTDQSHCRRPFCPAEAAPNVFGATICSAYCVAACARHGATFWLAGLWAQADKLRVLDALPGDNSHYCIIGNAALIFELQPKIFFSTTTSRLFPAKSRAIICFITFVILSFSKVASKACLINSFLESKCSL